MFKPAKKTINYSLLFFSGLIFILIIKFGSPASLTEVCNFPLNASEWLIFTWPTFLFSLFSAILFFLSFIHKKRSIPASGKCLILCFLWIFLTLFSLLGFINASCFDIPYMQCFYIAGICTFSISMYCIIKCFPLDEIIKYLLGAVFYSTLLIVLYGLYQYFWGFNDTRNFIVGTLNNKQISFNENFFSRLMQNYIFSTFSLTNTLAGYIILTLPVCVWYTFKYASTPFLKNIFPLLTASFSIAALLLTGSRSAILALCIASVIIFLSLQFSKKIKIITVIISVIAVLSGFYLLKIKGSLNSTVLVRLDYYKVTSQLFLNHVLTGSGWGSFFYSYGFMKTFPSPEAAHSPHNYVLYFFSQSGIFAGFTSIAVFLYPIIQIFKKVYNNKNDYRFYLLYGIMALFFHMLMDVDFQIPATILTAVIFCFIGLSDDNNIQSNIQSAVLQKIMHLFAFCISILIIYLSFSLIPAGYTLQKLNNLCTPISDLFSVPVKKSNNLNIDKKIHLFLNDAIKYQPYSSIPWAITGEFYLNNRNWRNAETCFKKAIIHSPQRASFYYSLFVSQIYQRKITDAIKNLKKAKDLFPNLYKRSYIKIMSLIKSGATK